MTSVITNIAATFAAVQEFLTYWALEIRHVSVECGCVPVSGARAIGIGVYCVPESVSMYVRCARLRYVTQKREQLSKANRKRGFVLCIRSLLFVLHK